MRIKWRSIRENSSSVRYYAEVVVALILLIQGLLVVIPSYDLPDQEFWSLIDSPVAQEAVGIALIVGAVLILVGLATDDPPLHKFARRAGAMLGFLIFSLLTFIGVLSEEVNDVYWLATAGLALLSAIMYVRIGRAAEADG